MFWKLRAVRTDYSFNRIYVKGGKKMNFSKKSNSTKVNAIRPYACSTCIGSCVGACSGGCDGRCYDGCYSGCRSTARRR